MVCFEANVATPIRIADSVVTDLFGHYHVIHKGLGHFIERHIIFRH